MAEGGKMEIRVEMIKRWFVIFVFVGLFDPINARAPGGSGQIQPELRVAIHQVCKASYKTGDQYYEELLTGQDVRRHFCQAGMDLRDPERHIPSTDYSALSG